MTSRKACLWILLCAGALHAHRLPFQVYSTAQGLPRNSTHCLVPDSTGLLWICTTEGLARFDGYRFQVFGGRHAMR